LRVRISLSYRSIALTETLYLLAGVLLGKTSLDWLYGLIGGLPRTVSQSWRIRFGRVARLRRRRWIKLLD
jgi:hypothetical protein